MAVRVQIEDFDLGAELAALRVGCPNIGALVSFCGLVRNDTGDLQTLELEHYPEMTEKALAEIEEEAHYRWDLNATLIVHRFGLLEPGEQIMMVATASLHRKAAFEAADFLMDFLKSRAPFWKKETGVDGAKWVDAKEDDETMLKRW
jgi:molybdopterin synthase catalytic subunit